MTPEQKRTAERLINLFERSGPDDFGYANTERDGDGRGWTCGVAGFTTGTGDALEVVEEYAKAHPLNRLTRWLPILRVLAQHPSEDDDLPGFDHDWRKEAANPTFHRAQDIVRDRLYFAPAMRYAEQYALVKPLSKAALYDAAIEHGCGDDPDSLGAMLFQAATRPGERPDEYQRLDVFLDVRARVLSYADNPKTRACWRESLPRVRVWRELLHQGNFELLTPIVLRTPEYEGQRIE